MRKIYLLLAQSDTFISEAIRFVTRDPYNHAAIGVDDSLTYFWTFGRKLRFFPVVGGFSTTTKVTIMSESRCKSGWTVAVKPPGPTAFTVDTTLSSRKHSVGVNDP